MWLVILKHRSETLPFSATTSWPEWKTYSGHVQMVPRKPQEVEGLPGEDWGGHPKV